MSLDGLRPEPYEVTLKTPEGREGREKIRRIKATPLPAPGAPTNTSPPTIAGSPATETGKLQQGQTLTASPGSWTNHPTSFSYLWLRCDGLGEDGASETVGLECEPITIGSGETPATGETYVARAADVGSTIAVEARATNAQGWSAASSEAELVLAPGEETEPPAPRLIGAPTITGSAIEGRTLTAHQGSWENEPRSYEEKWFRCKSRNSEGTGAPCKVIQVRNPSTEKKGTCGRENVRAQRRRHRPLGRGPGDRRKHGRLERRDPRRPSRWRRAPRPPTCSLRRSPGSCSRGRP